MDKFTDIVVNEVEFDSCISRIKFLGEIFTYSTVIEVVEGYPEILHGAGHIMCDIAKEFESLKPEESASQDTTTS